MAGLVKIVDKKIKGIGKGASLRESIKDVGCEIKLENAPRSRLIARVDKLCPPLGEGQKRCDYLVVAETEKSRWVVLLELKGGRVSDGKANEVVEQLQASANAIEGIVPNQKEIEFRPTLAHGKNLHKYAVDILKSKKIRFYNRPGQKINWIKCGAKLREALDV